MRDLKDGGVSVCSNTKEEQRMSYVLGTRENVVRFYQIIQDGSGTNKMVLLDRLDTHQVTTFGDKKAARQAALSIGLKTWRYIKI
jgi:hypothetical protein